jgi:hypothetical protein
MYPAAFLGATPWTTHSRVALVRHEPWRLAALATLAELARGDPLLQRTWGEPSQPGRLLQIQQRRIATAGE